MYVIQENMKLSGGQRGTEGGAIKEETWGMGEYAQHTINSFVKMPYVNRIFNNVYTMNLKITS